MIRYYVQTIFAGGHIWHKVGYGFDTPSACIAEFKRICAAFPEQQFRCIREQVDVTVIATTENL